MLLQPLIIRHDDAQYFANLQNHRQSHSAPFSGPVSIVHKKTSLNDFKKLLAQQTLGSNPHRISAKQILEKSAPGAGHNLENNSSQKAQVGGSLRKRQSPWVDNRFSVIQEEVEGSREHLE